jgi:hypothetical protein
MSFAKKASISRRMSTNSMDPSRSNARVLSNVGIQQRNIIKYENTYKTEPDPEKVFNNLRIEEHATQIMNNMLMGEKYDPARCPRLTKKLAESINDIVKQLPNPRFKLVTVVFIGERKGQDLRIASRCLWDSRVDNSITINYENENLFATAIIYGLYYE